MKQKRATVVLAVLCALAITFVVQDAVAQAKKPNILVIFGDDIGYWNVSAYNRGMMGYRTPTRPKRGSSVASSFVLALHRSTPRGPNFARNSGFFG